MQWQTFRAKPVTIQAVQLTKTNRAEVIALIGPENVENKAWDPVNLYIKNPHGIVIAEPGNWVVKGTAGPNDFYPCDDGHFKAKYDATGGRPA